MTDAKDKNVWHTEFGVQGIVDFLLATDQDKGFYAFRIVTKRFHFGIS